MRNPDIQETLIIRAVRELASAVEPKIEPGKRYRFSVDFRRMDGTDDTLIVGRILMVLVDD